MHTINLLKDIKLMGKTPEYVVLEIGSDKSNFRVK